ncbi:MAG: hypothetical protein ABR604_08490 [Jatrophihabitantaceae bacterium]
MSGALPLTGGDLMMILGILLVAAAAVAAVELVLANHAQVDFHMWRWTWHFDALWLAVVGAAILACALLGLAMLKAGGGRARRLRRERRELAVENRRLAERADVAETTSRAPASRGPASGAPASGYAPADVPDSTHTPAHGYGPATGEPVTAMQPVPGEHSLRADEAQTRERVEGRPLEQ